MFPTATKPDRLSPLPPNDGPIPSRRGSRASDLLFGAKPQSRPGLERRPKQAGDGSILAPIPPNKPALADRPLSEWNLHPIVDFGVIRHDKRGSGDFGAPRDGGARDHGGVDIAVPAGTSVYAPVDGRIAIITLDRVHHITGIQITTDDERILKVLYVGPLDGIVSGARVRAGQEIGKSQSLQKKYSQNAAGKMTDHVHFQVERRDREPADLADPTEVVRKWLYPPKY